MKRIGTRLAVATTAVVLLLAPAFGQSRSTRAERELFAAMNQSRRQEGLIELRWDESLATAARLHAMVMAKHRSVRHTFENEPDLSARIKETGAHFTWLSENVTQGPVAQSINEQFMRSPSHRANILDADMNSVGIGVVERDGQLFAVEDFAQLR